MSARATHELEKSRRVSEQRLQLVEVDLQKTKQTFDEDKKGLLNKITDLEKERITFIASDVS